MSCGSLFKLPKYDSSSLFVNLINFNERKRVNCSIEIMSEGLVYHHVYQKELTIQLDVVEYVDKQDQNEIFELIQNLSYNPGNSIERYSQLPVLYEDRKEC